MSSQKGGILQMAQSYNFNRDMTNNLRGSSIDPANFYTWHRDNMYQSSYAKFHSSSSVQPKNTAIPGYGGFVPSLKAQNIHAKGFTNMTKQSFNSDKLGKNLQGLATTGFNVTKQAFIDNSKLASSSKYGKSALQKSHPNWNSTSWRSTTQQTFQNPNNQVNPTYRQTDKFLESKKQTTKSSGFGLNHQYCDGKGWKPDPVLRGDINRTQYKDRFNKVNSFHRNTFIDKIRKLQPEQTNYRFN